MVVCDLLGSELCHIFINEVPVMLRPVVVYAQWLVSTGFSDSGADKDLVPRMVRYYLVVLAGVTIGLLFDHLQEGVADVAAFSVGSAQLLCCAAALAILNSEWHTLPRVRLLVWCLHGSTAMLILDIIVSSLAIIDGRTENVISVDLTIKIALYLFVTSLPFFALDRELARDRSRLTFVWKIWTIEAVDFCTILYGAIQYASKLREDGLPHDISGPQWLRKLDHGWDRALTTYVVAFVANAVFFGALASAVLARVLRSAVGEGADGSRYYTYVAIYVFVLDAVTDLPVWLVSLVTRAYVHNFCLTFNVLVNLLALVRGVYITLTACLDDDVAVGRVHGDIEDGAANEHGVIFATPHGDSRDDGTQLAPTHYGLTAPYSRVETSEPDCRPLDGAAP
ncbi:hypothetical protein M885DRAFT_588463 [Pelagophyceae sp. CCMP2097]|nr:hypothetical protein M885DRAFT_588463 [Pelagophyceae sp. CCMP2097]|mmetsp:Transcript_1769/g.5265  ORF Transcript_1769/g.5265 Transcript_1769/m.5265 type:complete len:395 (+) Transcript_1769:191-1375(+)